MLYNYTQQICSNFNMYTNPPGILLQCSFWFSGCRSGRDSAFLTSSQAILMLLVLRPHLEQQGHGGGGVGSIVFYWQDCTIKNIWRCLGNEWSTLPSGYPRLTTASLRGVFGRYYEQMWTWNRQYFKMDPEWLTGPKF